MSILDNFSEKKAFCLECEMKVNPENAIEFRDGFRCKECAVEYKKNKGKK